MKPFSFVHSLISIFLLLNFTLSLYQLLYFSLYLTSDLSIDRFSLFFVLFLPLCIRLFSYFLTSHHVPVHYRLSHSLHLLLCSFSLVFSLHSSVHLVRVLGLFLFLSFALNPLSKKSSQIFLGKFADYSFFENHLKFCSISFFIPRYGDFSSFVF